MHKNDWERLNNEVASRYSQGSYDRAVVVARKALQVAEETVGSNHPAVATSLENMSELYRKTGREKAAEELAKRVADVRRHI
jgi:hypothetical protein